MKPNQKKLTLKRLKYLLHYNDSTGVFVWQQNSGSCAKRGNVAGGLSKAGYIMISIDGTRYLAHRVAWFYYYGAWPAKQVDHRNQVKSDNWIENLREADHCQNLWNSTHRKGRIFPKGVSRNGTQFCARINVQRKCIWLGNFTSIKKAADAYEVASKRYHGEFSIFNAS